MEFFLNELSLHNQFQSEADFLATLKMVILPSKQAIEQGGFHLYCHRTLANQPISLDFTFKQVIQQHRDPNLKRVILSWLDKYGPFMEDVREHQPDDYLYLSYNDEIVTDKSLGEAAYRLATDRLASTLSFAPSNFELTPLPIIWDTQPHPVTLNLPNFWQLAPLTIYIQQQQPPITSWNALLQRAQIEFIHLIFLESVAENLAGEPFNTTIAERVMVQLNILNQLATCFDEEGQRNAKGHDITQNYFQGDNALFSDESENNKKQFKQELTFQKSPTETIFCPFHGKIRHRTFRLHFSWPIRYAEPVYIAYIGPKITKA